MIQCYDITLNFEPFQHELAWLRTEKTLNNYRVGSLMIAIIFMIGTKYACNLGKKGSKYDCNDYHDVDLI